MPLKFRMEILKGNGFRFSEQIMSADKYPSISSRQMKAIVYLSREIDDHNLSKYINAQIWFLNCPFNGEAHAWRRRLLPHCTYVRKPVHLKRRNTKRGRLAKAKLGFTWLYKIASFKKALWFLKLRSL